MISLWSNSEHIAPGDLIICNLYNILAINIGKNVLGNKYHFSRERGGGGYIEKS